LLPQSPGWQVVGVQGQAGQGIVPVWPLPSRHVQVPHRVWQGLGGRALHRPRLPPLPSHGPQSCWQVKQVSLDWQLWSPQDGQAPQFKVPPQPSGIVPQSPAPQVRGQHPQSRVVLQPSHLGPHSSGWQVSGVQGQAGQEIVPVWPLPSRHVQVPHRVRQGFGGRALHRPRLPPLPSHDPQSPWHVKQVSLDWQLSSPQDGQAPQFKVPPQPSGLVPQSPAWQVDGVQHGPQFRVPPQPSDFVPQYPAWPVDGVQHGPQSSVPPQPSGFVPQSPPMQVWGMQVHGGQEKYWVPPRSSWQLQPGPQRPWHKVPG